MNTFTSTEQHLDPANLRLKPVLKSTPSGMLVSSAQVSLQAERRDIRRVISCVSPPIHIQHNKVCR